ncbi:MAG: CRISPR-associated protein Cas6 [Deltaproteobacteria bacterium]|nr:MAG: CRISPR-associated protein Cas6 [Deltaproteobacteria bacterium]
MLFGRYEFCCRFQTDARLPLYKGSTFRGVFGHALKATVCALQHQECSSCLLKSQCLYTLVFETHLALSPPPKSKIASPPHPFVIQPPLTTQTDFSAGDLFVFSLLLFGEVNHHLPYFVYAFERMGKLGIGKHISGCRGQFILERVSQGSGLIYSSEEQQINIDEAPSRLTLARPPAAAAKRLTIQLKTPLRLKFNNRYISELPFHVLTRAMLRRISTLMTFYDNGEPDLDYRGLPKRAEAVRTVASNLYRHQWQRYSQRQRQKMPLDGIIGTVTYEGELAEFLPLVEFCQQTHIGKQTAFGLGEMAMVG